MAKRNAGSSQSSRKRRKAGASYSKVDADASSPDEAEDIRVWNITTSETTGRVFGKRKTHRHLHEDPVEPLHEEPPTVEEIDASADPEPSDPPPAKVAAKGKRKRVRVIKENDSVSFVPMDPCLRSKLTISITRHGWGPGLRSV